MARELTLSQNELVHPERIGNSLTWMPGRGLDDIANDLRLWDSRLTLAFHKPSQRWEVWRFENGQYSLVCRSRPGLAFPGNIVQELQARDTRRGYDVQSDIERHNAAVDRDKERQQDELTHEVAARVAYSIRRDIGHKYG